MFSFIFIPLNLKSNTTYSNPTCILGLAGLLLFSTCSKNIDDDQDENPEQTDYFIRFDLDGVTVDLFEEPFTPLVFFNLAVIENSYFSKIQGWQFLPEEDNIINIIVDSDKPLELNTDYISDEAGTIDVGVFFQEGLVRTLVCDSKIENLECRIRFTALTAMEIQGTFSGTWSNLMSGETAVVTNGEFRVPRIN